MSRRNNPVSANGNTTTNSTSPFRTSATGTTDAERARAANFDNPTFQDRLYSNGVEPVPWHSAPQLIHSAITCIFGYVAGEATTAHIRSRAHRLVRLLNEAEIELSGATEANLASNYLPYLSFRLSSPSVIPGSVTSRLPTAQSLHLGLSFRQDEYLISNTVPNQCPPALQGDWPTISQPKPDFTVGYRISNRKQRTLLTKTAKKRFSGQPWLQTAENLVCARLVFEIKSSTKGGTTAKALYQLAAATATCCRALDLMTSHCGSSEGAESPDPDGKFARAELCLVFGIMMDEEMAYTTAAWKSATQDDYSFAKISLHSLTDDDEALTFFWRLEGIIRWLEEGKSEVAAFLERLSCW